MKHTSQPGIRKQGARKLATTLFALCLPVIAALFFSSGIFGTGSGTASQVFEAPAAHAMGQSAPPHDPQVTHDVSITDSGLNPSSLTVGIGHTVKWTNNSSDRARIDEESNHIFRSDDFEPGESFSYTFTSAGTFNYVEDRNDFQGTIIVSAAAGGGTPTPVGGVGSTVNVRMVSGDNFDPTTVYIRTGTNVRWTNDDGELHSTSSTNATSDNAWQSPPLNEDESYTKTFLNPGTYTYLCTFHDDEMFGTVVVSGAAITPTPGAATSTPAAGTSNVNIQNYQYQPKDHVITLGSTVHWTNLDADAHTVTSDVAGQFGSANLGQNGTFDHTFNTAGTYAYHCAIHPGMTGSITVLTAGGSVPTPGPSNTPTRTPLPQPSNTPGGAPQTDVSVLDFSFSPATVNVQQGTIVRWTNNGQAPHTVSSKVVGQFESGNLNNGQGWQFTFNTAGTFEYQCAYHSNMQGTVNVLAPGSTPIPQATNTPRATSTPGSPPAPGLSVVDIVNYVYAPVTVTVNLGDKVRWTNSDNDPHSITSLDEHAGLFDSGEFGLNGTYERVFDTPGTYKYFCTVHGEFMTGYVVVQGSGGIFADVATSNTFYPYIVCLADRGVLGGYSDGTFRPGNPATRGQLAKIISNAAGFNEAPTGQTFDDVAPDHTFYSYVERIASRGIIGGYDCGGPGEPCGASSKPYFRPGAGASRGQIAKIVAGAANLTGTPTGQTFADVAPDHTFYTFVEQLAATGAMGGYSCGTATEQCDAQNRPFFRPNALTTRGQIAKIVSTSFFPECGF